MKFSNKSFIVLFVTILAQSAPMLQGHILESPANVLELTEPELIMMLKSKKPTVIMGHMKNCSHCGKLMKTFELKPQKYQKVNFFTVNGAEKKLHEKVRTQSKDKFRIPGYPSIVFVRDGEIKYVQIGGNESSLEENIKKLNANKF